GAPQRGLRVGGLGDARGQDAKVSVVRVSIGRTGVMMAGVAGAGRGRVVLAEAERLGEAVAAVASPGTARGGAPLVLLEPLVLLDERGVVGLDVLARLDSRAEPDLPG